MTAILVSPHNDDETLFASFLILRHNPDVVVCLYDSDVRAAETREALSQLMVPEGKFFQWHYATSKPDWASIRQSIHSLADFYDRAFAPKPQFEVNGHSPDKLPRTGWGILQHDMIGMYVVEAFGPSRTTFYQTYARWDGKTREGRESPCEPHWIAAKLRALACYGSQHREPSTRTWFLDNDLREYLADG